MAPRFWAAPWSRLRANGRSSSTTCHRARIASTLVSTRRRRLRRVPRHLWRTPAAGAPAMRPRHRRSRRSVDAHLAPGGATDDPRPILSGKGVNSGDIVTVADHGTAIGSATVKADGHLELHARQPARRRFAQHHRSPRRIPRPATRPRSPSAPVSFNVDTTPPTVPHLIQVDRSHRLGARVRSRPAPPPTIPRRCSAATASRRAISSRPSITARCSAATCRRRQRKLELRARLADGRRRARHHLHRDQA